LSLEAKLPLRDRAFASTNSLLTVFYLLESIDANILHW